MNPSRIFIVRPVATSLLMAAIMLVGAIGFFFLPLSALPEGDYPTIQVQTFLPGGSPEVMTTSVTGEPPAEQNPAPLDEMAEADLTEPATASALSASPLAGSEIDVEKSPLEFGKTSLFGVIEVGKPDPLMVTTWLPDAGPLEGTTAIGELDEAEQFDIDFTVMAGELAKLLDDIIAALGTEAQAQTPVPPQAQVRAAAA